jgi:hypothetical protein
MEVECLYMYISKEEKGIARVPHLYPDDFEGEIVVSKRHNPAHLRLVLPYRPS